MNVLVVSPHPDDETLGAGGTLLRYKAEGHKLYWVNVTTSKGTTLYDEQLYIKRHEQLKVIGKLYGFEKTYHLEYPTTMLDSINDGEAITKITEIMRNVSPNILILPDYNDAHSDHKSVFDWFYACSKIFRCSSVKRILTMEIISETDFGHPENPFIPNYFVDVTDYMDEKIKILKVYDTELGNHPFPRSIESVKALATVRGVQAGAKYAEAFRVVKIVE